MRQRDLFPFFAIAFLIAWGIGGLYMFASDKMARLFGNLTGEHPFFYLAVYAAGHRGVDPDPLSAQFSWGVALSFTAVAVAGVTLLAWFDVSRRAIFGSHYGNSGVTIASRLIQTTESLALVKTFLGISKTDDTGINLGERIMHKEEI